MNETNSSDKERCDAVTEIISSVAKEQDSIAQILLAEAEKIKYVTTRCTDPYQVLDVNKSVDKLVNTLTKLEIILSSKLELFNDCLCTVCDSKTGGYSLVSMTVETENGGRIERDDDLKTFRYFPGIKGATIKFIPEPDCLITYLEGMPSGLKYDNHKLLIPDGFSWPQTYKIKFMVGEGENAYEIILMNII